MKYTAIASARGKTRKVQHFECEPQWMEHWVAEANRVINADRRSYPADFTINVLDGWLEVTPQGKFVPVAEN